MITRRSLDGGRLFSVNNINLRACYQQLIAMHHQFSPCVKNPHKFASYNRPYSGMSRIISMYIPTFLGYTNNVAARRYQNSPRRLHNMRDVGRENHQSPEFGDGEQKKITYEKVEE